MEGPTLLRIKRKRSATQAESIVLERNAFRALEGTSFGSKKNALSEDVERALQLVGMDATTMEGGRKRVRSMYRKLKTYEEFDLDRSDVILSLRDVLERRERVHEADVGPCHHADVSNVNCGTKQEHEHVLHPFPCKKKREDASHDLMLESLRMYDVVRLEPPGMSSKPKDTWQEWNASIDEAHIRNDLPTDACPNQIVGEEVEEEEYVYDVYVSTDEDADAHPKAPVVYFDDDLDAFYYEPSERQEESCDSEDSNDENYMGNEYPDESDSCESTVLSDDEGKVQENTDWSRSSEEYEDYM